MKHIYLYEFYFISKMSTETMYMNEGQHNKLFVIALENYGKTYELINQNYIMAESPILRNLR